MIKKNTKEVNILDQDLEIENIEEGTYLNLVVLEKEVIHPDIKKEIIHLKRNKIHLVDLIHLRLISKKITV